jgi:hypothetical protein
LQCFRRPDCLRGSPSRGTACADRSDETKCDGRADTAAIVLLVPTSSDASPITSAADRVFEVALGAVIWLTISLVLFPSGACGSAIEVAARTLERLAPCLGELMAALKWGLDVAALHRIQDGIGEVLTERNLAGGEAEGRTRRAIFGARHGPCCCLRCSGCATTV